jgi:hypothetical protein
MGEMLGWASRDLCRLNRCFSALLTLCLLMGCGRVGLKLIPVHDRAGASGASGDGGIPDAGGADARAADGGSAGSAGSPPDAGAAGGDSGAADAGSAADGGAGAAAGASGGAGAGAGGGAEDAGCPVACQNAHGSAQCTAGQCVASCELGYADCDGNPANGCEASTTDSLMSCGACAVTCNNAHGSDTCAGGLCSPICAASFGDCDGDAKNGCEADLNTVARCGDCALACSNAHGTTSCPAGVCAPSCGTGYGDCDTDRTNGCESNLNTDPTHCGSCTKACGTNGQICVAGVCQASACTTGRGECDGDLTVTCETDLNTSLANCGYCSHACTTAHGTPSCAAGACGTASCNASYADCDADPATGCEAALNTTTAHCGACATACTNAHGTTSCAAATCVPSCGTGYGDCDASRPNGCETALNTTSNCGNCGNVCPAGGGTAVCNSGVCGVQCNLTGTFALKLTVQVTWPSQPYVSSGSGTVYSWSILKGTHSGNSFSGTVVECGKDAPDFKSSIISERYKVDYPNALFDHAPMYLPAGNAAVTLGSASPGASFALARTSLLMGASMADPVNGSWPSSASGLTQVDMDADGKAGVSAVYRNSGGDVYPPTSASLFGSKVSSPYIAARTVFSLSGTLTSCTQSSGNASVTHVDTRIFGCRISGGSQDCSSGESSFLDGNQVVYAPGTATYSLVKIANAGTCADVRSALP